MNEGLSEFFYVPKKFMKYLLIVGVLSFLIGCYLIVSTLYQDNQFKDDFKENKEAIMNDVLNIIHNSKEINENQVEQIQTILNKHSNQLNHIAIFNGSENKNIANWIAEHPNVQKEATTINPINNQFATKIFDIKGISSNNRETIHDGYDLGTVVKSNGNWVVQYEFSQEYRDVIEMNNSLLLNDYSISFQIPFILLTVFAVILAIWLSIRFQDKRVTF